ncbi:MAG TPA: metallophosphoesterase [Silvibacterium sp.]|jgi:hypothetical protein|nr:metallophosphoesterase [Silvibacterium sp.]
MAVSAPEQKQKKGFSRRDFLKVGGLAAVGLPLYAAEVSRHEISVERLTIRLPRLPEAFHGLKIAQLSDFHYAQFTEPFFVRRVVNEVNRLKPDVVAFTGDYVTHGFWSVEETVDFAYKCAEILSGVESPERYAVLGNHDCMLRPHIHAVTDALETHGIPVLENRALPLEREGQRLWFAGTGDAICGHVNLDEAVPDATRKDGEPVILLAHEPDILPQVAKHNVDLMLSGHTHGGQVRIPFLPAMFLPELGQKFVEGLFQVGSTQLYVNRGIGTVNLPIRFNCPPEITLITLA